MHGICCATPIDFSHSSKLWQQSILLAMRIEFATLRSSLRRQARRTWPSPRDNAIAAQGQCDAKYRRSGQSRYGQLAPAVEQTGQEVILRRYSNCLGDFIDQSTFGIACFAHELYVASFCGMCYLIEQVTGAKTDIEMHVDP